MKPSSLLIPLAVMTILIFVIEWMAYRLVKRRWDHKKWWSIFRKFWLTITVSLWLSVAISLFNYEVLSLKMPSFVAIFTIAFFINLIPKIVLATFQVIDDFRYVGQFTLKKVKRSEGHMKY